MARSGKKSLRGAVFPAQVDPGKHPVTLPAAVGAGGKDSTRVAAGRIYRQTQVMTTDPNAELSSLASQIDALIARLAEMIDAASVDQSGKESHGLVEAERHLQGARRELIRVQQSPG